MIRFIIGLCLLLPIPAQSPAIHPDDLVLIEANIDHLSPEHLAAIYAFMIDSMVIAERHWFDISAYASWDDYNFHRPVGDTVLAILARRDLFLDPARQLNNPALTNMSSEALAALAFSQVYVEEKWDHEPPWDGDSNRIFNWVHPTLLDNPNIIHFLYGDFIYRERTAYWWATYWSLFRIGKGNDYDAVLNDINPPRLAGHSYPLGNQLYTQTAETVYWYADYLRYGAERYGAFEVHPLDTRITFPSGFADLNPDTLLSDIFTAPFAHQLRRELTHPESAAFWNVMRFVHAGARQREGGASPDYPGNGQPPLIALRYLERTPQPVGRPRHDISAFALLTTVYSDSILLDFTNWNGETLIVIPSDPSRPDGIHRLISERNKAIRVIEQMGNETIYPNATHISGSRGLGLHLTTRYDDPINGDFLPYTTEEAHALVMALITEAEDYGIEASRDTLCHSPMLTSAYERNGDSLTTICD
jgi:hypothetical protein